MMVFAVFQCKNEHRTPDIPSHSLFQGRISTKFSLDFGVIQLIAINKWISSITIPNLMTKMKSPERVDIPRYFYFCLTPPELGAICENMRVFLFSKKKTHRGV